MFLERLYWEDGMRLDSEVLDKASLALIERSTELNHLPFNLNKGIISFNIDNESLASNLILIKDLKLYIDGKKLIFFDKTYPLSLQLPLDEFHDEVPVFVNVRDRVIEKEGHKYIYDKLSLSLEHDYSAKYSLQIALFKSEKGKLSAKNYDFPLLSLDHYLMQELFIKLNRLISELKAFNRLVFSTSRSYASILLSFRINKLERNLEFAESNRLNSDPLQIFNELHDVYSLIQLNLDKIDKVENIVYDFNRPITKLNLLIDRLLSLCEHRKINNFVRFELQGQKYICENFPEEFFVANRYYLFVKKKSTAPATLKFNNKDSLRVTSISRNRNIVTLSLSGVRLLDVNHSTNFAVNIDNIDAIYEIQKGSELDFIVADRSAVFSAFNGSENFDFFIAFT
ncbi:type VI secretion system baseplate subunit TssK [Francisella uliginis]|uniref:Intracellular growth locus n=1 Tax=Francisella uliginis TaxID=573570 RepID=A0A1L4BTI7_9GAMM|nr:type VI secretion system baseplate subunit TssK [Francisella uliginis]API87166.1 intracellular growth locus [Francisella uliginis]